MVYRLSKQNLSRRQLVHFNKKVHAIAHKQGITPLRAARDTFEGAYSTTYGCHCPICYQGATRDYKRGSMFVRHIEVDDGGLELRDEDVYDFKVDFAAHEPARHQTDMTVSLLDIAKPAKRKGGRPHIGVHEAPPAVSFEDIFDTDVEEFEEIDGPDDFSQFDEEWEEVGDDQRGSAGQRNTQRSYSAVVRGSEC